MTKAQKEQIQKLRSQDLSYGEIARKINLNINTVKSYCRRIAVDNNAPKTVKQEKAPINILSCQECGKPIQQTQGRKLKRFCSDTCRMKWWNGHPEMVQRKNAHEQICPNCGKKFLVYGTQNRKYCSHKCYITDRFGGRNHDQG